MSTARLTKTSPNISFSIEVYTYYLCRLNALFREITFAFSAHTANPEMLSRDAITFGYHLRDELDKSAARGEGCAALVMRHAVFNEFLLTF